MIGLVLSMLNARRAQAVTLFLLAAISVGAAVAGPVAVRAVDAAVVRLEVANATGRERTLSVTLFADPTSDEGARQVDTVLGNVDLPGFEIIRGGETTVAGPVANPEDVGAAGDSRLVFRDGVCEHLVLVAGRCLVGGTEIIIGSQTAQRSGLEPGDVATIQAVEYDQQGARRPAGNPISMTVVGVYDPVDPDEPYWGGQAYFPVSATGRRTEAIFVSRPGLALVPHRTGIATVDAVVPPDALTASRLEGLGDEVAILVGRLTGLAGMSVGTAIPDLVGRVDTSRELAGQLGPVAFVPLVGVSFFVIYLAVAYGVFGRRPELALVALRGVSKPRRWVLATGETVVAILLGAPVGYVLGHLGVGLVAQVRLGSSDGAGLSLESIPYAAAALAIALAVALLGQRRALREPVVDLLRGVPRRRGVWSAVAFEVLLVALAVVATLQLRTARGGLAGLGLLVPGLVIVAVALVAARLNVAVTGGVARFALRRGLLGGGLAAVQLARRPGSRRLFVLLALGAALLAFVAAGIDVAARAREDRATVQTGAERILQVVNPDASRMLAATQAVDPDGAWSMAVVVLAPRANDVDRLPLVAVDTSRLGSAAAWRSEFGADAATVAQALSPPEPSPLQFQSASIEVDVEVRQRTVDFTSVRPGPVTLNLQFTTDDGRRVSAPLPDLTNGSHTRAVSVPSCADGCRLVGFSADLPPFTTELFVRAVRQLDPSAEVVPTSVLSDPRRWHASPEVSMTATPQGLRFALQPIRFGEFTARVGVVDAPVPVPIAVAGDRTAPSIRSLDDTNLPSRTELNLSMLPRFGNNAVLTDLRSLERLLVGPPNRGEGEIWLGPDAPADAIDQFRKFGLQVLGEVTADESRVMLARQGPALALQFHLAAAAFAVLLALAGLGLVAAVDRRQRAADLRALRVQGLPRRMVRRAALWGYLSTVVLAALTGLGAALLAWVAAGDRIPIFSDTESALVPPRWPLWPAVVQPWAVAALAMAAGAVVAAWALRVTVARVNGGSR